MFLYLKQQQILWGLEGEMSRFREITYGNAFCAGSSQMLWVRK